MDNKGMMAIVRELPENGLMVTLMDGCRQYTLMPRNDVNTPSLRVQDTKNTLSRHSQYSSNDLSSRSVRYDAGAQAVDDRYASSYKIQYCNLRPTSPPVELTEFPPQRAEVLRGRENFEVGGFGSGSYSPRRSYEDRGLHWPSSAAASTPTPKISTKSNAFANSLRKYPCLPAVSSSEIFERLVSYTTAPNSSRISRYNAYNVNEGITCYNTKGSNRYAKCRNIQSVKTSTKKRCFESPTRLEGLQPREYNKSCRYQEINRNKIYDPSAMETKHSFQRSHSSDMKTQGGNVDENFADCASKMNQKSLIHIPTSKVDNQSFDKDLATSVQGPNNDNVTLQANRVDLHSSQSVKSTQTVKSYMVVKVNKKTKSHLKSNRMRSPIQSHTKCKKIKHKPTLHDSKTDKFHRKRLKIELLSSIQQIKEHAGEDKLEEKIKTVLCKILDCIVLKHFIKRKNAGKADKSNTEAANSIHEKHDVNRHKHSKEAAESQHVVKEEMLPITKYHVLKEHENKVTKFILSKIIKIIFDIVRKIEINNLVNSRSSFECRENLDKLKEVCESNKILYNVYKSSHVKKFRRYINALRKLVKNDIFNTQYSSNILQNSKEQINLKLQSIVNINEVLKKIQSSSKFQAQYVTNMLLNQYCTTKQYSNENMNCHQKRRTSISPLKCISDTYIMIHDSSQNKSILTKNKIHNMNLDSRTKLLENIKNKYTIEASYRQTQQKYKFENKNNALKHVAVCGNDTSSNPFSFRKLINQNASNKQVRLNHKCLLHQVEEKVKIWLSNFGINLFKNNAGTHNIILTKLTEDLTSQLNVLILNQMDCTIKEEYVAGYLKYIICKHLFLPIDGLSYELGEKLSELIKDLILISTSCTAENIKSELHHHHSQSLVNPSNSIGKEYATTNVLSSIAESPTYQVDMSLMEDIYSKVVFRDESIRQVLPKQFLKQASVNENSNNCINDSFKNSVNRLDLQKTKYKSGIVNVAIASTNTDISNNTGDEIRNGNHGSNFANDSLQREIRQQVHQNCIENFRSFCKELPILAINPDWTELAREAVAHNLTKLFYMLIEDCTIANDFTSFEFRFEDEIDGLLDILPQTEEMKKVRQGWKIKVVMEAVKLLEQIHQSKDDTEFEEKLNQTSDKRQLIIEQQLDNVQAQQLNNLQMAEQYLVSSDYKEQNPLKFKIYMNRLMDRVNDIFESVKYREGKDFLKLPVENINKLVLNELKSVPIPNNDIETEEIELVEVNDEIEKWYNELPVTEADGINSQQRKILKQSLARKVEERERQMHLSRPSVERDIKHEISIFLSNKGVGLQKDEHLNINNMVDELANRLRRRRDENLDYDKFQKHLPYSSSMHNNFVNGEPYNKNLHPTSHQNNNMLKENERVYFDPQNQLPNTIPEESHHTTYNENKIENLQTMGRSTSKGILGTSQLPGPSSQESYSTAPRTINSPEPASIYNHATNRPRTLLGANEINDISQYFYSLDELFDNSRNVSTRPYNVRRGKNQSPNEYSMHEDIMRRNIDTNSYVQIPRQEAQRSSYVGHSAGTTSTAQAATTIPEPINGDDFQRDQRNNFIRDSGRERDHNRTRCRCGGRCSRRRRHICCCEDYFSIPPFCFFPPDCFF